MVAALLGWYTTHGRPLVIRATRDPYAIWIGEVMSQQTQIGRVGEALPGFLTRFPDVPTLAGATTADVVRAWGGLGYPRRAVALRDAARSMVERHGSCVPRDVAELEALPGIGPYTARAIAATAYGMPVTALDVNARRVMGRVLDGEPIGSSSSRGQQHRVDSLAPPDRAADWNHALMDLGAAVCRPVPDCPACPIRRWCAYAAAPRAANAKRRMRRASAPFHATNRYARGRVLAVLRDAPTGAWTVLDPGSLAIEPQRIGRAATELLADGLIELEGEPDGRLEARLATR
ncbi:MAG: A/G-specific adenine glycosylase [Candidatus Limnocylindrales bacterium]